jgi:hypothetical protein
MSNAHAPSLKKLKQLYETLTPGFAVSAAVAPESIPEQSVETPTYDQQMQDNFPTLTPQQLREKENTTSFMADGGSAGFNGFSIDPPKFSNTPHQLLQSTSPSGINQPHLGALRQLFTGLGSRQKTEGGLAKGGLPQKYAEAAPHGHNPEFITGLTGYYAQGKGTGQSDDIPAMLHDGDYVADADLVASLGDGSSKAGAEALEKFRQQIPHQQSAQGGAVVPAKIADGEYVFPASFVTALGRGDNKEGAKLLDAMREEIRAHKRSAPTTKIPPKAKSPLDYLKMVKG